MEKILKTLETLKLPLLNASDASIPGSIASAVVAAGDAVKTKKKERISHCVAVTDAVCTPSIQALQDFPKLLENVTEVLFQLCNDTDSDIRLVAADCLNRLIRSLKDQLQHRFQTEIYKEIKKNQSPRSLRVALSLFAYLSSMIRPQKCRAFILSMLPCFTQISKRTEEMLYENLAVSFLEIFTSLGPFVNDNEVKILCKDFKRNLESNSATIRRSSALILVYVCQYSRKPNVFLSKLLLQAIELLMPNLMEKSVSSILGTLVCVRHCIPPLFDILNSRVNSEHDNIIKNLIQVYEICLILCNHDDHNVITTSLETLQQLLTSPVDQLVQKFTSSNGIQNSFDTEKWTPRMFQSQLSSSQTSLTYSDDPANLLLDSETEWPKFRNTSASNASEIKEDFDIDESISSSRRNSDIFLMASTSEPEDGGGSEVLHQSSDDDQFEKTDNAISQETFPELQIGSLYEKSIPLYYCARFLAYNFLLAGRKGFENHDNEIRVSVKVLAISCLTQVIDICPEIFHLPLSPFTKEDSVTNEQQTIQDVCLYASHNDPLIRGYVYALVGTLIKAVLKFQQGTFAGYPISSNELIPILEQGLKDSSNIAIKYAISGVRNCLVALWRSEAGSQIAEDIFKLLFASASNPYWLIKVDLIDVLISIEWDASEKRKIYQIQVRNLLLDFIGEEDVRVRSSAVAGLARFLTQCAKGETWNQGKQEIFCEHCIISEGKHNNIICALSDSTQSNISQFLGWTLSEIIPLALQLENKYAVAGYFSALASLSEKFSPIQYASAWNCCIVPNPSMPMLLALSVDLLRASPIVTDIFVHNCILALSCNLFLGMVETGKRKDKLQSSGVDNVFMDIGTNVSTYGIQLLHHSLSIMKLYHATIDNLSSSGSIKKQINSPMVSPVRKFAVKMEVEKKSAENESDKITKGHYFSQGTPNCAIHFKKIADSLQQSWKLYKSNLDKGVTQKFKSLLTTALKTLGDVCLCLRSDYSGLPDLIEEVLGLSSTVFYICPTSTLKCIRKILKCLFSLNVSKIEETCIVLKPEIKDPLDRLQYFTENYHSSCTTDEVKFKTFSEFNFWFLCLERLMLTNRGGPVKSPSEKSSLGNYIRQFEPIVITALKMYTTSSDVAIQAEVLALLSELIKGHVNYALVDSSQIFLGFVIKQIGFLEEGYIRNPSQMIERMFEFLALLSHEQHHSKKFIDVPKLLRLCDGLVASEQDALTHCIPALRPVVRDLFVQCVSSAITDSEKKDVEMQREVLFQIIIKESTIPESLPAILVLVQGRKATNEFKWKQESATITTHLLHALENGDLVIHSQSQFQSLIALLYSVSPDALPSPDTLIALLEHTTKMRVECINNFLKWTVLANTFWLVLIKSLDYNEGTELSGILIVELLHKFVSDFTTVIIRSSESKSNFCAQQISVFIRSLTSLLRKAIVEQTSTELLAVEHKPAFIRIARLVAKLSLTHPALRTSFTDFLIFVHYPFEEVWSHSMETWLSKRVTSEIISPFVSLVIQESVNTCKQKLEEWFVQNFSEQIVRQPHSSNFYLFLERLNHTSRCHLMQNLIDMSAGSYDPSDVTKMVRILQVIHGEFVCETSLLCLSIINNYSRVTYTSFEVSQFACFIFAQLIAQNPSFPASDIQLIQDFSLEPLNCIRYPRLVSYMKKFLSEGESSSMEQNEWSGLGEIPVLSWCCAEINSIEGPALAKILSTYSYSVILKIFNHPSFNDNLLQHVLRYIQKLLVMGTFSKEDANSLLLTEKRSELMESCPLGVATFDFIFETLDRWENDVHENFLTTTNDEFDETILSVDFASKLLPMWLTLTEILKLKASVIDNELLTERVLSNNFIPTPIFTFSFQFMRASLKVSDDKLMQDIPLHFLHGFLEFAATAICDLSFLHFFNDRDHYSQMFSCILSCGAILRSLVEKFNINYVCSQSDEAWSSMNESCVQILREFHYMVDFVYQVRHGKISMETQLFHLFKDVVAGLARCELVNGWLLVSHLGWKPQSITKSQIFPPIQHIPLEILQNEKDLLLKYIFKLNFFGVASKIQFEENWMTFLSVINSYGDENFQLHVISIGLRALTMMLEQSVKIKYIPDTSGRKIVNGIAHINLVLKDLEPEICSKFKLPPLILKCTKAFSNKFKTDVNSCMRFLIDLFSQWLQNPQAKMPLFLMSEVVQSIVSISEYFEDIANYTWMNETLTEIFKSFEKEDEILWPHLIHGIFYSASKIPLETDSITMLVQILEGALTSPSINISNAGLKGSLSYLQNNPDSIPILNVIAPFVLKNSQLSETLNGSESRSYYVWKLLLFIWIYASDTNIGASFEEEILGNILTVLNFLNKVYVSVRLLVFESLKIRVEIGGLKPDVKRKITKVALESLRTPNRAIFLESMKLFLTIFYCDFSELYRVDDLEPEVLMQMAERSEVLFQMLKSPQSFNRQVASRVLPLIVIDFLPPSEIMNRVIAEFISAQQTSPELLSPTVAQVFEKARRRPKEGALVREWILSSLPSFVSNSDISRGIWSLTLFFIGVSKTPNVSNLLPFAELRRHSSQIEKLFLHSALDFYSTLDSNEQNTFRKLLLKGPSQLGERNPYSFFLDLINESEIIPS